MLKYELVPQRIMKPGQKPPVRVDAAVVGARYRTPYLIGQLLKLVLTILGLKITRRLTNQHLGVLLKEFCQRMGVLWIKVGQLLSMRADLAPLEVRNELAKLQDRVKGFPGTLALQMVEDELGTKWNNVFSEFDVTPLAAASIGQVHRAVLKEGQQPVAVKVQRPDVELVYQRDIRVVGFIISIIEYLRIRPYARWRHMLWEVEEAMREELDYRYEASNMRRLKRNLKLHGVYCPIVFDTWSTRRILVMEFVTGVLMADYLNIARTDPARLEQWHEANNVTPRVVARRLLHSFLRQAFEDNLFHSDLHPGNIVLLRDSRIAFLDFGSAGTMERDFRRKADMFLESLGTRQYSKAIDLFFLFSDGLPPHNLEECKAHMVRRLLAWDTRSRVEQLPFEAKTLNRMMDELVLIAAQYRIAPVWSFFRMTRAMATMDASLQELDPHADFHDLIIDYHKRRAVRSRDRLLHDATHRQPNFRELMDVQQTLLDESVYRGTIVRRTAQVFESAASSATRAAANMMKLTSVLLWGLFGLGILAWLYQVGWLWGAGSNSWLNTWIGGDWGWQAWVILLGLVHYLARRLWQLARKFMED